LIFCPVVPSAAFFVLALTHTKKGTEKYAKRIIAFPFKYLHHGTIRRLTKDPILSVQRLPVRRGQQEILWKYHNPRGGTGNILIYGGVHGGGSGLATLEKVLQCDKTRLGFLMNAKENIVQQLGNGRLL